MKLRQRLALLTVLLALPVVVGFSVFAFLSGREQLVEATYEATLQRMESNGRARCEAFPERFGTSASPRRRRRGPPGRRPAGRVFAVYDDTFHAAAPNSPPLEPELRAPLEAGEPHAALWLDSPARVRVAMRLPWDGPCATVVIERPTGAAHGVAGLTRAVGTSALIAALTALAAFFAMGPVVRRVRGLTSAVRAQASERYASDVPVEGGDEIAELAAAFNEAGAEIRKRLEELSARDQALTEFLASTTHDVMIPLTVLQGHLSDLASGDIDAEKVKAALEESHYMASLMRNLAAAARLDAGEELLTRHPFDLRDVVERVVARHGPIARAKGVSLDHAVPEDAVSVHADSTLAERLLGNLMSNAIRYNEPGGHVAVVLAEAPFATDGEPTPGFALKVLDDGPGIPDEELARVSERRFRGGAARQRKPTGLGLGLHIVRDVAERHEWALRFESPDEGGLCVHLSGRTLG